MQLQKPRPWPSLATPAVCKKTLLKSMCALNCVLKLETTWAMWSRCWREQESKGQRYNCILMARQHICSRIRCFMSIYGCVRWFFAWVRTKSWQLSRKQAGVAGAQDSDAANNSSNAWKGLCPNANINWKQTNVLSFGSWWKQGKSDVKQNKMKC